MRVQIPPSALTPPLVGFFIAYQSKSKMVQLTVSLLLSFGILEQMKKILKDKRIIVVAFIIIFVILFLDFNQRMILLSKLRGQEKQLTQEYGQLVATANTLKTEIANADSDKAVEKWAREEAGMIQEGDIPIVLLPPSATAIPTPTNPSVIVDEVEPWEIWQELFFGD